MRKLVWIALLAACTIIGCASLALAESNDAASDASSVQSRFSDLDGHWARSTIERMANAGYIGGYPDGTFRPNATMTFAEFSTILARIMNIEADVSDYSAVRGHWARNSINALIEEDIIQLIEHPAGLDPNRNIMRYEIAIMTSRALAARSYLYDEFSFALRSKEQRKVPIELPFKDEEWFRGYYRPLTAVSVFAGIVSGLPDGNFNPRGNATRAEASVMLQRFIDARNKQPDREAMLKLVDDGGTLPLYMQRRFEVADKIEYVMKEKIRPEDSDIAKLLAITQFVTDLAEQTQDPMPEGWLVYKDEPQTAYGALIERSAIADGYADATKVMLDALGMENMIVEMSGAPRYYHSASWNLVKLSDGQWYHIHNSLNDTRDGNFRLRVFLATDDEMLERGFRWNQSSYPASGKQSLLKDLQDDTIWNVNYANGTIYYMRDDAQTRERTLYSRNLAETGPERKITDCPNSGCGTFVSDGEYIYVYNTVDHVNGIYRMRTDGSDVQLLQKAFSVDKLQLTEDRRLLYTLYDYDAKERVTRGIELD